MLAEGTWPVAGKYGTSVWSAFHLCKTQNELRVSQTARALLATGNIQLLRSFEYLVDL